MFRIAIPAALCALIAIPSLAAGIEVSKISPEDAKAWICYTVPLPKQIEIKAQAVVNPGGVGIEINAPDKHPVYEEIKEEFTNVGGSDADMSGDTAFWIKIQVGGPQADSLKTLANSNQAYRIDPSQDEKSITITALSFRGAYYGWTTVRQLVQGRSSAGKIVIPLLTVTDWPDMEKRGLWGTDNYNHLQWLGQRKMNHMEQINARGVDDKGNFFAYTRDGNKLLDTDSEKYAIDYVPVVLHLEQNWDPINMAKFYPQMKAKNATHGGTLCYAEPMTIKMISEWIYQLAKQCPTNEVDVWMSENLAGKTGCQCDECKKAPYGLNEARAVVKAWEMAKQKLGKNITMYMLTSEATEETNKQMFEELPKDVRIWYYHSLLTYSTIHQPMLRQYLADAAKNGRWIGVCPNLDAWTHNNVPFDGAAFIKYRMDEFISKDCKGLLGYATPRVHFNYFNVEAAAEWTWNNKGRSTRDFAYSYAVRQGYKNPQMFADWSETLGPVAWDVYGSNYPAGQRRGQVPTVKEGLVKGTLPTLGQILWDAWPFPFGSIKTEKQLNDDVAAAAKAVQLATQMRIPEIMYQTLVIDGYIRSQKALYGLRKLAPKGGSFAARDHDAVRNLTKDFLTAAEQVERYLPKWESTIALPEEKDMYFTERGVSVMQELADDVKAAVAEMGVK